MTPANYQVLVDLSTSPNVTESVRAYLVEMLREHRIMREAISMALYAMSGRAPAEFNSAEAILTNILAHVQP